MFNQSSYGNIHAKEQFEVDLTYVISIEYGV